MQRDSVDHITKARRPTMRTARLPWFHVWNGTVSSGRTGRLRRWRSSPKREAGAAFGDQDRTVGVHAFHDGHVAVLPVGGPMSAYALAAREHHRRADMRGVVHQVSESTSGIGPIGAVAHVGADRKAQLGTPQVCPQRALAGRIRGTADRVAGRAIAGHRIVHAAGAAGIVVIGRRSRRRCRRGSGIVVRVVVRTRLLLVVIGVDSGVVGIVVLVVP